MNFYKDACQVVWASEPTRIGPNRSPPNTEIQNSVEVIRYAEQLRLTLPTSIQR
jgi:hypothetical protein